MMSDLMREEFEQRFPVPRGVLWRDGAYHREKEKQCTLMAHLFYLGRWETWQASRECLVIDLPEPYAVIGDYAACGGGRVVWDVERAEMITDKMCEKTVVYGKNIFEALGLKVKP